MAKGCHERLDKHRAAEYLDAWEHIPPEVLDTAAEMWRLRAQKTFLPAPGELLRLVDEVLHGTETWSDSWRRIMKALGDWSRTDRDKAQAAWDSLSDDEREYVRSIGGFSLLADIDAETLSVHMSHFRSAWEQDRERRRNECLLPPGLRATIVEHQRIAAEPPPPILRVDHHPEPEPIATAAADVPAKKPGPIALRFRRGERQPARSKAEQLAALAAMQQRLSETPAIAADTPANNSAEPAGTA